jgi:hypothetical protein
MDGSNYAGIDWASAKHDVLVSDEADEELLSAMFAHDEAGLRSLCRTLVRLKVRLVAIEHPDGVIVERLLDAGLRRAQSFPSGITGTFECLGRRSPSLPVAAKLVVRVRPWRESRG